MALYAQTKPPNVSHTTAEFRAGYGNTIFGKGLKERYNAGNFTSSGGGLASLAAFRKFQKINYLALGIKYKSLGAGPARGDSSQEMFFNYWGAAIATKYFPFDRNARKGVYVQADYFFVSQFTQKYRNSLTQFYDHQFAIGSGIALGVGYDFAIAKAKPRWTIGIEYETNSRTGEVTGIGDKNFRNANLGVMVGVKF
jgi:hypothetical protein